MSSPSVSNDSWWWCRCSTTVSGGGPTETELYRDSFKYFKSYGGLSLSELPLKPPPEQLVSPKCIRKKGRKPDNGKDHGKKNSKNGSGGGGDAEEIEGILLRHPGDHGCPSVRDSILTRKVTYDERCKCYRMWGLRSPENWKVVELTFPAGLIVIKNPFTPAGQRYWISQTLLNYPHHPQYITNMDNLNRLERIKNGQSGEKLEDFKLDTCGRDFYEKLRWVTFGYHHDWDTKVYTEERRSKFPEDLADMTRYMSQILGFEGFEAEAAIANYYHMDSTLSGHVDRSEVNQGAPLFSLSFGQTAIFLIGGKTKMDRPQPVLLQSGDIAIMSGESRLSYHGVPKILPSTCKSWEEGNILTDQDNFVVPSSKSCKRPKMDGNTNNKNAPQQQMPSVHDCVSFNSSLKDPDISNKMNGTVWNDFLNDYINKSRINLNIRQVLFPGQKDLYSSVTNS